MLKCWDANANERPTFEEISESLDDLERVQVMEIIPRISSCFLLSV